MALAVFKVRVVERIRRLKKGRPLPKALVSLDIVKYFKNDIQTPLSTVRF